MSNSQVLTAEQLGQGAYTHDTLSSDQASFELPIQYNVHRLSASTGVRISGFSGWRSGRAVLLNNVSGYPFTIGNEDELSDDPRDRVACPNGEDYTLSNDEWVFMLYDNGEHRWILSPESLHAVARSGDFADLSNVPPQIYKFLDSSTAATNNNLAQPWFPSGGAVTLKADTLYRFQGQLRTLQGTTAHNVHAGFGGTVGVRDISWTSIGTKTTMDVTSGTMQQSMRSTTATVRTTQHDTTGGTLIRVEGVLRTSTAGTLIPQFLFSTAPGSPTVEPGTYFELVEIGPYNTLTRGTWA